MDLCARGAHLKVGYRQAIEQQHYNKRVRGGYDSRASDMTVVIDKPEHGPGAFSSFILDLAARLKLAVVRLFDEHVSVSINNKKIICNAYAMYACNAITDIYECMKRASMAPPAGQGRGVGCQPVIVEETKESSNEDSEEMASNMS
ncbi:hypothetical protein JCGZ_03587 [Jatropha curcas]|uniref:Uncharacterized protein n=1 Tax=Jatropha curcas TaxID=180498 RepID=A0A067JG30_JATCU|nr:hypothetical protein JCGZ_03587 [Jatropha curcas]